MIILTLANSNPMTQEILAEANETISLLTVPITPRDQDDCCSCSFVCGCNYMEYAFASTETYENDLTQRFAAKQTGTDTVTMELWKDGVLSATLNDATYGTYYNGVGIDNLYVGYEVDWKKVYDTKGAGLYTIKFIMDIAGIAFTRESHQFKCMLFDACAAEGTVRIESTLDTNIQGVFNYDGMNQRMWTRVRGRLAWKTPKTEDIDYQDSSRKLIDYQTKTNTEYTLMVKNIPSQVYNLLIYEMLIAESIDISDYSLPFFESYISVPLKRGSYDAPVWTDNMTKVSIDIKMKPRFELPLGRIT